MSVGLIWCCFTFTTVVHTRLQWSWPLTYDLQNLINSYLRQSRHLSKVWRKTLLEISHSNRTPEGWTTWKHNASGPGHMPTLYYKVILESKNYYLWMNLMQVDQVALVDQLDLEVLGGPWLQRLRCGPSCPVQNRKRPDIRWNTHTQTDTHCRWPTCLHHLCIAVIMYSMGKKMSVCVCACMWRLRKSKTSKTQLPQWKSILTGGRKTCDWSRGQSNGMYLKRGTSKC